MHGFLLVLCSLAVVFSANIDYVPRGLSIRATGSLTQTLTGPTYIEKRQAADDSAANSAIRSFFAGLKTSVETVEKLSTPTKSPSQAELSTFFDSLLQSEATLQTAVGTTGKTAGMTKEEIDAHFAKSAAEITKLKQSLGIAENKPEAVHVYLTGMGQSITSLQAATQGDAHSEELKFDVLTFFSTSHEKTVELAEKLAK